MDGERSGVNDGGMRMERRSELPVGEKDSGEPWVQLIRTDRIVMFCILCGGELGPQPVRPVVMFPDDPNPTFFGHACGNCLHANSFDLADAIEDHADWMAGASRDLKRIEQLARTGRFQRPSYDELVAANKDAQTDLEHEDPGGS